MKAKVFISFCFLFIFTIFLINVSAVTIEDLFSKDNVFTVKNLTTGETKEVTIPKFTKGDFSKATNYVLVYKNENDYFFQFTSDNKNYIVVYSNISGGYEIRCNGNYQVIGSDVYYQALGDYYLSSSGNLYGENVYIYSTCDLYKVTDRDEAMQEDLPENAELIAPSMDINSHLKLECEYNEDYTKATIYAILEDGKYDDYIFYSLNGHDWIYKENTFTVEVTYNTEVFFKVEDVEGNIKYTNSVVVDKIKTLSDINFNVTFDFTPTDGSFRFTPILKSNLDRIFFKPIGNLGDFKITEINSSNEVDTDEYVELKNGVTYVVKETKYNVINGILGGATNIKPIDLTLSFKILNPQGEEVYTKEYNCILHPYDNSSISGSGVEDINVDWSFESAVDNIKSFFETSKEFFNLLLQFISDLPMWIVSPLYTLLIFAVILFVYHLLRG